jgi:iron(III) transport system ATP-binding protein
MPAPAIDAVDLTKRFGRTAAVDGADLRVEAGELVALLGPSGSGKTTLLRLVAGFEVPDAGSVAIGGRTVAGEGVWAEPDRRRIGMVFQDGALFPHLTVADNIAFGRPRAGRAGECLELVGLAARGSAYPHELSGGERQRVALARALAADPDVVLLDEPFTALDEALRAELREEVARILRAAGASALLVTHSQEEALSLADVVAVMRDGRVVQVGPPEDVYGVPADRWVAEFLGDADVVAGHALGGTADTELGRFPAPGLHGAVEIVLRPERVALIPETGGSAGAPARVVRRSYFGHDQLVHVELASGTRVRARTEGSLPWRPGDAVRVQVEGPVVVLAGRPTAPNEEVREPAAEPV